MGWIARSPRRHQYVVHPFIKDFPADIFIDKREIKKHEIKLHTIVRAEIRRTKDKNYIARVEEFFPSLDDPDLELQIIAETHGFPTRFSKASLQNAEQNASRKDYKRIDLRSETLVTIDGETAKDFDDAICVQKIDENKFRLLVCVADVSYYVDAGSALDREAYDRGTSIYFPGMVVPMLPEVLSNHICSLIPHQERYALACEMLISKHGDLMDTKIYPATIQSKARLTYTQVANYYDGKTEVFPPGVAEMLSEARELSQILQESRYRKGYLDLGLPETEIEVNRFGDVLKIRFAERSFAHRLIESFMVIANEAISSSIERKGFPSIYRVHEQPDPVKLKRFAAIVKHWGFKLPSKLDIKEMQNFLIRIKGHAQEKLLALSLLRFLKQAQYTAVNVGHFGLGSESYCHFTSPIRRYPDLIIHRILRKSKFLKRSRLPYPYDKLEEMALRCSELEQRAAQAERDMKDLKKARFMASYVGENFDAYIISIKDFGIFVEIAPFGVEGLIPLRSLPFDRWQLDENEFELYGHKTKKRFRLGDRLKVRLTEVDRLKRQITFHYLSHFDKSG